MTSYINKNILLHKLQERCDKLSEQYGIEHDYTRGYGAAIDAIDIITLNETADVQEVKHGKWAIRYEGTYKRAKCYCSVCGKSNGIGGTISNQKKPYCPNCGAKMDGGESE